MSINIGSNHSTLAQVSLSQIELQDDMNNMNVTLRVDFPEAQGDNDSRLADALGGILGGTTPMSIEGPVRMFQTGFVEKVTDGVSIREFFYD
jgi:hypothetical protein